MPVRYLDWITRQMLRDKPEARFVFGDNAERAGMGGQAGAMRGEPNAIGVATKWAPGQTLRDFFVSGDKAAAELLNADIDKVQAALDADLTVYVPRDGLGTGLSELPRRAPDLHRFIINRFRSMQGEACPWEL